MSGREVAVAWICVALLLSTLTVVGGVVGGVSTGGDAEIHVTNIDLEDTDVYQGDDSDDSDDSDEEEDEEEEEDEDEEEEEEEDEEEDEPDERDGDEPDDDDSADDDDSGEDDSADDDGDENDEPDDDKPDEDVDDDPSEGDEDNEGDEPDDSDDPGEDDEDNDPGEDDEGEEPDERDDSDEGEEPDERDDPGEDDEPDEDNDPNQGGEGDDSNEDDEPDDSDDPGEDDEPDERDNSGEREDSEGGEPDDDNEADNTDGEGDDSDGPDDGADGSDAEGSDDGEPDDSESSGSPGSAEPSAPSDDEPAVVRSESADGVTVEVDGVVDERYTAEVALAGPSETRPAVSLSALTIDTTGDREAFELTVGRPRAAPREGGAVPYGTALGYVEIGSTLAATDTSAATLRFDVDRDALPDGLGPEDVAVMRYADGEWTTGDVTHSVEGESHTAATPTAAPVAVVALKPGSVDVVESEVPADRVRRGYETTLRATVENPGDRAANRTLTVTMAGERIAEREVSLGPRERATVRIAFEPVDSGTVSLDGTEAGSISLFGGAEGTADAERETETEANAPGFGLTAAALALLVVGLAVRAGRR